MTDNSFPDCIKNLPRIKVGFPGVKGWLSQGEDSQVVFFEIEAGGSVAPHDHGAQWGIVIEGELQLTIGGETKVYSKGDSYHIPAGAVHAAEIKIFTRVMDFFAEHDRYQKE